jgi:hypothetical protein
VTDTQAGEPRYAIVVPVGALPASEVRVVGEIGCHDSLADGPIEGVTEERDERGEITRCVASSQGAVREAARRALIENAGRLFDNDQESRILFVRPAR